MRNRILFLFPAAGMLLAQPAAKVDFDQQIAPVLEAKCYSCHGPQKQLAGLRLDRRQAALRGGYYGKVIVPGDSANSKLIHRISGSEAGMQMPPAGPLEPHEIALLRAWIDQGPDYGRSQLAVASTAPRPLPAGWQPFVDAIVAGNNAAVRAVLAADPSLATTADRSGTTALMHAAGRGGIETMRILLKAGANAAAANQRGATALTWALGDFEKVKLLLDAGASVDQRTREGRTPLHIAAQQPARPEVLRALLAKGADAKAMDVAGITPLHLAAGAGAEAYIRALVAAGANVNAVSGNGSTPLILAAGAGSSASVNALLDLGADATKVSKRNVSALAAAASWGDVELMDRLIRKGAPVSLADSDGWTPLGYAAYSEQSGPAAVRLLLHHGATAQPNKDGETPAQLAAKRGATEIVALLQARPGDRVREAVRRAFIPLVQQSTNFVRIGGCNSCHNQDLPLYAQSIARQRGLSPGADLALAPEGGSGERTFEHSGLLSASSLGYIVMSRVARQMPADTETDAMVNYMLTHQESDGRWISRSNRQPFGAGDHHATAFAIFTLRAYARHARQAEAARAIARGAAWLAENPPVSNQDAAMQVMGLAWAQADPQAIATAAAALRKRQHAAGGWAQLPTLDPDAYATGQALYALALAGTPASAPAYAAGVDFLLRTQAADGTWRVKARSKPFQPYFESGFPYGVDQFISAAGTSWAALALSMTVEPAVATARR